MSDDDTVSLAAKPADAEDNFELISEADVLDYMDVHPEFFDDHPELLEGIDLEHDTGTASSLIERQVIQLRQRNETLRLRLHDLAGAARANEMRVKHINTLATQLMASDSGAHSIELIQESLQRDFGIDATMVGIYEKSAAEPVAGARMLADDDPLLDALKNLVRSGIIECGPIDSERSQALFGRDDIRSGAIMVLDRSNPLGLLSIGSTDATRYLPGMGTLFLDLLSALSAAAIRRSIDATRAAGD